jgi:hypothetical protein
MDAEQKFKYREEWLTALVGKLRPRLQGLGYSLPDKLQITCGFPSTKALASKNRRIGECWSHEASKNGTVQILISPTLDDALRVADVVVHELGHATGIHGHKGDFKAFMKKTGLTGKPTATEAGPELKDFLGKLLETLGELPSRRRHRPRCGGQGPQETNHPDAEGNLH